MDWLLPLIAILFGFPLAIAAVRQPTAPTRGYLPHPDQEGS